MRRANNCVANPGAYTTNTVANIRADASAATTNPGLHKLFCWIKWSVSSRQHCVF